MPKLTPQQKLAIYRKLESDISGGLLLAVDIFNEHVGDIVEKRKAELLQILADMDEQIERRDLKDGEKGEKGDRGDDGRDGKDGVDGKDGKNGKDGKDGRDGRDGRDGIDGETPEIPVDPIIQDVFAKVQALIKSPLFRIEASQVNNLPRNEGGSRKPYRHGGGDTVLAGTNITITINSDGSKTISSTGGSGLTELTATGSVNSSNRDFTFISKPDYIVSDGVWYKENVGWTWSGLTATMDIPPNDAIWGFT